MQHEPVKGAGNAAAGPEREARTLDSRWSRLRESCESLLRSLPVYDDPAVLLDAVHALFSKSLHVRSCYIILQTFGGDTYRMYRSFPEPAVESSREWRGDAPVFQWFNGTYADHILLVGPTLRVGERQLAETALELFGEFNPSLCFPLMAGTEQLGLLLIGDEFPCTDLPSETVEQICLLIRNVNLALTRLGLLEEMQTTGRLPRGLAHDLQGLLTPISSFLELSLESGGGNEAVRDLAPVAARNLATIQDYILQARPSAKGVSPVFRPGRLDAVLQRALELVTPQYYSRRVLLEVIGSPFEAHLMMDEALMLRLIMNLLRNALAASTPGKRVVIELLRLRKSTAPGEWLRIRASDQGKGFNCLRLAQLLASPFGLREPGSDVQSFGLGLTICRRIAKMHGGVIAILSVENEGTVVEIDLPQNEYL